MGNFGSIMGGNVAEAGAGYALWKFLGKRNSKLKLIGQGMLIKVIGDVVENTASPVLANFTGGTATTSTASANAGTVI